MPIKYRRLSASGDYVFGEGNQEFALDIDAVAQAIKTRMQLFKGAFWRDRNDGIPMFQSILPSPGSPSNLLIVDALIQQRILGTQGVIDITSFTSSFDGDTRQYTFTASVQTIYSTLTIQDTI